MNIKTLCLALTAALSASLGFTVSSHAAPIMPTPLASPAENLVTNVHSKWRRGLYRHHGRLYFNGHRGYRHYRHGYRHYRGHYFPRSAFSVTIHIGPGVRYHRPGYVIRRVPRHHRVVSASTKHVHWCYGRYRSYRASDNSFQPYHGPRKRCRSPYRH